MIQDKVQYELKKSDKARHLRITIKRNGAVIVTVPKRVSLERGKLFAEDKMDWIKKTVARVQSQPKTYVVPRGNRSDYLRRKEEARRLVEKKLQSFNAFYGLAWNGIAIRNTASRWGSCSKKGNLNFSYRIVYLPEELQDYLVVHELCHLKEFNHSASFWKLVENMIPNYRLLRRQLRLL